ncbi:MAG: 3-deoxy-manno-octulosonate cytidylyltransferase [Gammaproteobacteria bacterium]|nr:3-deoxy-manno-octulosonate cytidylyltransferase [Gammaproteobacteria bacterium]MCW8988328.1 3-deoxy-manno-octulosonate cytidylyltransferase [Gammaproteobacteria bacterium]
MSFRIVIPARFASTRLPAKPLREICGKPMIAHVIERAQQSKAEEVIVATDSEEIAAAISDLDVRVCMTHENHQSGTERLSEVIEQLGFDDDQILINLQGDEPMMPPVCLNQVGQALEEDIHLKMATLCTPLTDIEELFDPHAVKVVRDINDFALYFTRAAVPWSRDCFNEVPREMPKQQEYQRHIGLYGYRAGFIKQYLEWDSSDIEKTESLEQLRVLYHGEKIKVITAATPPGPGVDTLDDLNRVCGLMSK